MNYYIQDFCCICLSISNEKCSNDSSKYADNLTPLNKIKTVFSGFSSVMESDDRICTKCSDTIGFIYEFHKTCLRNINIFSSYKRILKENQPKKQCGLFVNLNESKKFKENILTSEKIKVELPEAPLSNNDILLDTDFVSFESHSSEAAEINYEICDGQLETSRQDSEIKIEYEQTDLINECESNINKDFENISVQSTDEMVIGKEENQELIEDPLRGVAEEKSDEGQGHFEFIGINQSDSYEEKLIHVDQKIDSESQMGLDSKKKKYIIVRMNDRFFKCDICGLFFSQMNHLTTHKSVHTNEKPYSCDICGKSFTQIDQLSTHQLIHIADKSHKCDICGKLFTIKSELNRHKLIHTGEKPFKCDICGKLFRQCSNLSKHKLIHTGEKPYKCDICGKLFTLIGNLSKHMLIHTGEKPFKCDICQRSFNQMGSLKRHKLTHIGKKS